MGSSHCSKTSWLASRGAAKDREMRERSEGREVETNGGRVGKKGGREKRREERRNQGRDYGKKDGHHNF